MHKSRRAAASAAIWAPGIIALALCASCTSKTSSMVRAPEGAPAYRQPATVQDLMEGLIDPSADALWDSVAHIASPSGIEDRRPRMQEEWLAVRMRAVTLIEAANLLTLPGRRVANDEPGGAGPGPGELSHTETQERIIATRAAFVQLAHNLQDAGMKALAAIDAKDAQGLMDAGSTIDDACEACHVTYWYPDQRRP